MDIICSSDESLASLDDQLPATPPVVYYSQIPANLGNVVGNVCEITTSSAITSTYSVNKENLLIDNATALDLENVGRVFQGTTSSAISSTYSVNKENLLKDNAIVLGLENVGKVCQGTSSPVISSTFSSNKENSLNQIETVPSEVNLIHELPLPNMTTLIFLDLEATGLPQYMGKANVHVTEISMIAVSMFDFQNNDAIDLTDIRVCNKLSLCVKPRTRISIDAAKITGLNDSNLFRQQSFDPDLGKMIHTFIARLPQPACLIAHNGCVFDFPLLKSELQRVGVTLPPETLVADTLAAVRALGLSGNDTEQKTQVKAGKRNRSRKNWVYSLENLYRSFFKRRRMASHNSESDCQMLMMVVQKTKDKIMPYLEKNKQLFSSVSPLW